MILLFRQLLNFSSSVCTNKSLGLNLTGGNGLKNKSTNCWLLPIVGDFLYNLTISRSTLDFFGAGHFRRLVDFSWTSMLSARLTSVSTSAFGFTLRHFDSLRLTISVTSVLSLILTDEASDSLLISLVERRRSFPSSEGTEIGVDGFSSTIASFWIIKVPSKHSRGHRFSCWLVNAI